MLTASELISINWQSISVKKILEFTQSAESQVIYAVPILDAKNSQKRAKTLSKIGHGSLRRLRQLVIDIQQAGFEVYGDYLYFADFSSEDGMAKNIERYLHRKYASRRYSNANVFGFSGGTEVFDIAAVSVKQKNASVMREDLAQVGLDIEPKLPPIYPSLLLDEYDYGPAIELSVIEKPSDERFNSFDFSFILSNRAITRKNSKALHPVKIEWISSAGNSPFEFYGDPAKGTESYAQTVAWVRHRQASISEFISQWTLSPESCLLLEDYLDSFEKISLQDLVRFLARYGTRSSDADFIAPKLQKIFDDEVEFFKTHGKYDSGSGAWTGTNQGVIHLTGKARAAYEAALDVTYNYCGFYRHAEKLYDRQNDWTSDMFADPAKMRQDACRECDRDYASGFCYTNLNSGVLSFDWTYPIKLKCEGIQHVSDLLLNPLSRYPSTLYYEGSYQLVCEAFAVAPIFLALKYLQKNNEFEDELVEELAQKIWEYAIEDHDFSASVETPWVKSVYGDDVESFLEYQRFYEGGVPESGSDKWGKIRDRMIESMLNCQDDDFQVLIRLWPGSSDVISAPILEVN